MGPWRRHFFNWFAVVLIVLLVLAHAFAIVYFKLTNFDLIHEVLENPWEIVFEAVVYAFAPIVIFLILPLRRRLLRFLVTILLIFELGLDIFLVYYYASTKLFFDYYYFWFHRAEAIETLVAVYPYFYPTMAALGLVFIAVVWAAMRMHTHFVFRTKHIVRMAGFAGGVIYVAAMITLPGTPIKKLVLDAIVTHRILSFHDYTQYYEQSLQSKESDAKATAPRSIFLLQQESVNSEFVAPDITPTMYALSKQGVLLTHHYSTAIQTKRSTEVTLCSGLPSISISARADFSLSGRVTGELLCLPEILKRAGYTTVFFQNFDLGFQSIGSFMRSIGFDDVRGTDIMQPGDLQMRWGYREDVYFQRVFEYIREHYPEANRKLFVYTVIGATNHHPFPADTATLRPDVYATLPYKDAQEYRARRKNSLFAQDAYLKDFWDGIQTLAQAPRVDFYTFGDHPIAINRASPEYSFNAVESEQANFQTALLYMPGSAYRKMMSVDRVITDDLGTSHQGIAPTILESLGMPNPFPLSKSFYSVLTTKELPKPRCVVNVQPYFHPAVALVQYPIKVVLQLLPGTIGYLDLTTQQPGQAEHYVALQPSLDTAGEYLKACLDDSLSETVIASK